MNKTLPECFGSQGGVMLDGQAPDKCVDCAWFEKCHKITVAASVLSISDALDLIIQNGLSDGRLKGFEALEKMADAALWKK